MYLGDELGKFFFFRDDILNPGKPFALFLIMNAVPVEILKVQNLINFGPADQHCR
jgi:hypothetical protein